MTSYRQNNVIFFTYSILVRAKIRLSYLSNFRMLLRSKSRERITLFVKLLSDYLNVCDHNPPTLQTDTRTDGRLAMAIPRSLA